MMTQDRRVAGTTEPSSSSFVQNEASPSANHPGQHRSRRVEPFKLPRPQRKVCNREFTDPLHPDQEVEFSLRALDDEDETRMQQLIDSMSGKYITGIGQRHGRPARFPDIGGEPVRLTPENIAEICRIQVMQVPSDPELPPYDFQELVALRLTMPKLWSSLLEFATEVNENNSYVIPEEEPAAEEPAIEETVVVERPVVVTATDRTERSATGGRRGRHGRRKHKCHHRVKFLSQTCTRCRRHLPVEEAYRLWIPSMVRSVAVVLAILAVAYGISLYKKSTGQASGQANTVILPP